MGEYTDYVKNMKEACAFASISVVPLLVDADAARRSTAGILEGPLQKISSSSCPIGRNGWNIYEGIIEDVGEDSVDMLIPVGDVEDDPDYGMRQYFGQMGYGGYPRRFRRFRRHRFPFFIFRRLLFPHFY